MYEALFYIFAIMVVGSAAIVAFSKNIMYAAFSLLLTFFGVAGLYVLLNADFLALTQIMIYIGGILILIIFGVMLTNKVTGVDLKEGFTGKIAYFTGGLISIVTLVLLLLMYFKPIWRPFEFHQSMSMGIGSTIEPIGNYLLTKYILGFEAGSVVLLIAIIGAAMIARRKND